MKILIAGDFCQKYRVDAAIKEQRYPELFDGVKSVVESADYATSVKLNREQVRSKNKEALLSILFITLLPSFTTLGKLKKLESSNTRCATVLTASVLLITALATPALTAAVPTVNASFLIDVIIFLLFSSFHLL